MSLYDYRVSQEIAAHDYPVDALVMAAMRKADESNLARLRAGFPWLWDELSARYHAPGGRLETDNALGGVTNPEAL